jgi:hypothetical protein
VHVLALGPLSRAAHCDASQLALCFCITAVVLRLS